MNIVLIGSTAFLVSFLIHVLIWRATGISKTLRNIALLFILSISAIYLFLFVFWQVAEHVCLVKAAMTTFSLFVTYIFLYPGIQSDSPSCVILLSVEGAGEIGLSENEAL